jgi:hypothetical protein
MGDEGLEEARGPIEPGSSCPRCLRSGLRTGARSARSCAEVNVRCGSTAVHPLSYGNGSSGWRTDLLKRRGERRGRAVTGYFTYVDRRGKAELGSRALQ